MRQLWFALVLCVGTALQAVQALREHQYWQHGLQPMTGAQIPADQW